MPVIYWVDGERGTEGRKARKKRRVRIDREREATMQGEGREDTGREQRGRRVGGKR